MSMDSSNRTRYFLLGWAVPYIAVALGMAIARSAWLTILLYHIGILAFTCVANRSGYRCLFQGGSVGGLCLLVVPVVVVFGPILAFLLPHMLHDKVTLGTWLADFNLSQTGTCGFLVYFVLFNPLLEELHWSPLRTDKNCAFLSHLFFAGYHVFVLFTLMTPLMLFIGFCGLMGISRVWAYAEKRWGGLLVPYLSHLAADLVIVVGVLILI